MKKLIAIEFHSENEEVRLCGTNVKKEDLLAIHLNEAGYVIGVKIKGKGELWA